LEVGTCDYEAELRPLATEGLAGPDLLTADAGMPEGGLPLADKRAQRALLEKFLAQPSTDDHVPRTGPQLTGAAPDVPPQDLGWTLAGDPDREDRN
jgi:hypothetical protein